MLWLFRYIKGYLYIKISGASAYELINTASFNRIPIFSCKYVKGDVYGYITIENFRKLRKRKKGIKCRVKILKKHGLPFVVARYKNRYGILLGAIIFFLFLEFMSSFIWNIDVVGNSKINDKEILKVCYELDIHEGTPKKKIDTMNSAQQLLLKNENLAWASFNIESSKLTVNVTEIKKKDNSKTFSNLIATDDGIVEKIDVSSGNVLVKVGQEVKEGDILVSGIIEKADKTSFVASKGNVLVKQTKEFKYCENYVQEKVILKGKNINIRHLTFFNVEIPVTLKNISKCQKISSDRKNLRILNNKLPVSIETKQYKQKEKSVFNFSKEDLLKKINNINKKDIEKLKAVSVVENNTAVNEEDNGITVFKTFTVVRNIAKTEEIIIDSGN